MQLTELYLDGDSGRRLRCGIMRAQGRVSVFKSKDLGVLGVRARRSLAMIRG